MKKIWIPLTGIVVLIAVWLGVAWYTGTRIEAENSAAIPTVNAVFSKAAMPGEPMPHIQQISYTRGLFSSHARYGVTFDAEPNGASLMEFDVTISHGPFPLAAVQRGQWMPQKFSAHADMQTTGSLKALAGALMGGKPPLTMDLDCSYGNHCTGTGSVPAIEADLGPNAKLTFGGVQMRMDSDKRSDTDHQSRIDMELLPLSIGGQSFGHGQFNIQSDAQSSTNVLSWQTDQGVSKFSWGGTFTRPISTAEITSEASIDDLLKLLKTASLKLELSKPMTIGLIARAMHLTEGAPLEDAQRNASAEWDDMMDHVPPDAQKYLRTEGDLLVSDWQYADGKLSVNGQDAQALLDLLKRSLGQQLRELK
jgi:uncharacterized protein YdgA (DUF945 family)